MVRQRIFEGALKWIGPWEGLVFMRFLKNLKYFIFCLTNPPEMQISSHLTTTTLCPFSSSLAIIDASLPSIWCLASTTILFAQIPDPDTIVAVCLSAFSGWAARVREVRKEKAFRVFVFVGLRGFYMGWFFYVL